MSEYQLNANGIRALVIVLLAASVALTGCGDGAKEGSEAARDIALIKAELEALKKETNALRGDIALFGKNIVTDKLVAGQIVVGSEERLSSVWIIPNQIRVRSGEHGPASQISATSIKVADANHWNNSWGGAYGAIELTDGKQPVVDIIAHSKTKRGKEFYFSAQSNDEKSAFFMDPLNEKNYSAVELPSGTLLFAVGDIVPHGNGTKIEIKVCNTTSVALTEVGGLLEVSLKNRDGELFKTLEHKFSFAEPAQPGLWQSASVIVDCLPLDIVILKVVEIQNKGISSPSR
jgi:hypothetical protein